MSADTIFTATDLKDRRVELLDRAAHGRAVVRAVDGTPLAFLPLATVEHAEWVVRQAMDLHRAKKGQYTAFPWLRFLDEDDRAEFFDEAVSALEDVEGHAPIGWFDEVIAAWRTTALALADDTRRTVLLGAAAAADFVEVRRPEDDR